MRRAAVLLAILFGALLRPAGLHAYENSYQNPNQMVSQANPDVSRNSGVVIYGKVERVNKEAGELIVRMYEDESGSTYQLVKVIIMPDSKITRDGKAVNFNEVATNDMVKIFCSSSAAICKVDALTATAPSATQ
jgi:hypothetical protein